jgi:stress response protein SCP2
MAPQVPAPAAYAPPVAAAAMPADLLTDASLPIPTGSVLRHSDRMAIVAADGRPVARLFAGLGWTSAPGNDVDLDASAMAFKLDGKHHEVVTGRHSRAYDGAIAHLGDNRTGSAVGDAEVILLDLERMPQDIGTIVIAITSFTGQRFTSIANAYLRIGDAATGQELARFDLTDTQPSTSVLMASIRRDPGGGWQLRAIGEFHDTRFARNLVDFAARHALLS